MTVAVRSSRRTQPAIPIRYVGLATRTIAFALDAALINAAAVLCAAAVNLALTIVEVPDAVEAAVAVIGGTVYVVWSAGYFVSFWSTTGQTPGGRALRLRVVDAASGRPVSVRVAALRYVMLWLAALLLFVGLLLILVDERRRGLHDRVAGTVVIDAPGEPSRRT